MAEIRDIPPPFPLNPVQQSGDALKRKKQQKERENEDERDKRGDEPDPDHQIDEYV